MTPRFPQLAEETLGRALLARAALDPHGVASVMVHPGRPDEVYTISEVLRLADRYASLYRECAPSGRRAQVAVCLYHGVHLHAAFLGAVLGGQIPTMIAPPSPRMEPSKYVGSFVRMMEHIRPELVVAEPQVLDGLASLQAATPTGTRILQPDAVDGKLELGPLDPAKIDVAEGTAAEVAFIQHSSGTTGLQKGIALSHGAVRNQIEVYSRALGLTREDRIASWLPLYHDMGFIACFVMPMLTGVQVIELSPFDWVNHPALLLHKIQAHRATLCWLPNFAFSFLAKSVRKGQLRGLDLSSIRAFVNCSEPVMAQSHGEFIDRFAAHGVSPDRLNACYAMAENVFAVSQSRLREAPRRDRVSARSLADEHLAHPASETDPCREFVSNGPPLPGVEVRIAGEEGEELGERSVGEIWIRGDSLFSGYYERPDLTEASFSNGWYRTGDLGYRADGELYVAGRKKDLIIIQGRNFHPGDIEAVVSETPGVTPGRVVAFGESDEKNGTEMLVILAEAEPGDPAEAGRLTLEVRNRVAQQMDCTPGRVLLVPPRWLVKSTAGKIARADNRAKYEAELRP